jgi:hypothetical protein
VFEFAYICQNCHPDELGDGHIESVISIGREMHLAQLVVLEMSTPLQVGQAGEAVVVEWLKSKGYKILVWDTRSPGSSDIEAQHSSAHILVQVKSAILPNQPPSFSGDEEGNIKSRATKIGAEAYEARVQLDTSLKPVAEIKWRKL